MGSIRNAMVLPCMMAVMLCAACGGTAASLGDDSWAGGASLERALANGGRIAVGDYRASWANYRQCMVDKGYQAPPLQDINGLYVTLMRFDWSGMDDAQQERFRVDLADCQDRTMLYVDSAYRHAIGNPDMYIELDVAMVDCLRRHDLVPHDYTVQQYDEESERFANKQFDDPSLTWEESYELRRAEYSFDAADPQARTCMVAVNASALADEIEPWKPLG